MELSIAKLAVPRKQAITHKTADYTINQTAIQYSRVSGDMSLVTPTPPSGIGYYPRIYGNASPPSGWYAAGTFAYAEVYASTNAYDAKKARICYAREQVYNEGLQLYETRIHCYIRDDDGNESSFWINPGYYLPTGQICNNVYFWSWRYKPWNQAGKSDLSNPTSGMAPWRRITRINDNGNLELAIAAGTFDMTVKIGVYNYSTGEQLEDREVSGIDSDSRMGRGGLYTYQVCAGDTYKDQSAAALDPSGQWHIDNITRYEQDISVSWE